MNKIEQKYENVNFKLKMLSRMLYVMLYNFYVYK